MTRIVRTHYRYKRPPRKRKAVALEVPVIVTRPPRKRKASIRIEAPDEPKAAPTADEGRKSAIVTARRPGKRQYADVPEMTEEEHKRRGDLADAMFQEMKRQIAEKVTQQEETWTTPSPSPSAVVGPRGPRRK